MKPKPLMRIAAGLCGALLMLMGLSACSGNFFREDEIDAVFDRDYDEIMAVAGHLLSLEEDIVSIDFDGIAPEIKGEYGKPMAFQSGEIEQIAGALKKRGYYHIRKKCGIVIFDVWRKPFSAEFESGFAYSADGAGDLSAALQFQTGQRPLAKENWYYYETDYNEWRTGGGDSWERSIGK